MLRLDRNEKSKKKNGESQKGGGGLIAFVRRGFKLVKYEFSPDFENLFSTINQKRKCKFYSLVQTASYGQFRIFKSY
jgi:hypothetical protein